MENAAGAKSVQRLGSMEKVAPALVICTGQRYKMGT